MRITTVILAAASVCLSISACNDEEAPVACNWDSPRLMPTSVPTIPGGQEGDLAIALTGSWQHTFTITNGGVPDPLNDTTDIRFVFPGDDTLIYCQHITGVVEVGPSDNSTAFTIDGNLIDLPMSAGYTAVAWSDTVMLWDNNTITGEQYVLERR